MRGPRQGVLDLTSALIVPYAKQILGDYGADIIKIEPPAGDVAPLIGPMRNQRIGHLYPTASSSKRSIVIDLKKTGRQAGLARVGEG